MPFCPNCGSPVMGNLCQRCGWNATQMAQQPMQQQYPQQYQQPVPQQYAPPQGRSDLPLIIGAIVIAVIVIIAALLFVVLTSEDDEKKGSDGNGGSTTAPTGAFDFTETTAGNYTGGVISLSDEVKLSDCSWTIVDINGASGSQGPPILDGTAVTTGAGGLILTFSDTNPNTKVDAGDVITLQNAEKGDQIKLIHDTGKSIAAYTIP